MSVLSDLMLSHMTDTGTGSSRFGGWNGNDSGREVYCGSWAALVDMTSGGRGDICTAGGGADCVIGWAWVDQGSDHNAPNSKLQQKGYECWILKISTNKWEKLWGPTTFGFASVWDSGGNRGGVPNSDVGYPQALQEGSGISNPGPYLSQYSLEFWPNGGVGAGVRNAALVQDCKAVHIRTLLRVRRVSDTGNDDRASARYRARQGWDFGNTQRAGWSGSAPSASITFTRPERIYDAIASGDYRRSYPGYAMDGGSGRWVLIPYDPADPDRWYVVSGTCVYPAQVTGLYGPWAHVAGVGQYTGQTPYGRDDPYVLTRQQYRDNPPPDPDIGGTTVPAPPSTTKFMALGDSLTQGSEATPTGYRTWRGKVQSLLAADNIAFDFVGTQSNTPASGGTDPHHEGYGGAGIDNAIGSNNITDKLSTILATTVAVDVIIMLLGWNDVYNASTNIANRYEALVGRIRVAKPTVKLLLVTLPPNNGKTEAQTNTDLPAYSALNTKIRALASGSTQVAEGATGSYVGADYWDSIHLLQGGADKLGIIIYNRMVALGWVSGTVPVAPPVPNLGVASELSWVAVAVSTERSWFATASVAGLPEIQTTTLPNASRAVAYSAQLVSGGSPAPTFTVLSGSLPTGINLSSAGAFSGTPTGTTQTFTVRATNASGTDDQVLTLTVLIVPVITTTALPPASLGVAYTTTLTATGTAPIVWSITSGTLPQGMALAPSTGVISGTAVDAGTYAIQVTATGPNGASSRDLSLPVGVKPVISTTTLPQLVTAVPVSVQLLATGEQPIGWSVPFQELPPGCSLSPTGLLTGTPTTLTSGSMTVTATNPAGSTTQVYSWSIISASGAPTITSGSPPVGYANTAYSVTFTATGTATITFTTPTGSRPPGLSLASGGLMNGTPTVPGLYTFSIQAQNSIGTDIRTVTIQILPAGSTVRLGSPWTRFIKAGRR